MKGGEFLQLKASDKAERVKHFLESIKFKDEFSDGQQLGLSLASRNVPMDVLNYKRVELGLEHMSSNIPTDIAITTLGDTVTTREFYSKFGSSLPERRHFSFALICALAYTLKIAHAGDAVLFVSFGNSDLIEVANSYESDAEIVCYLVVPAASELALRRSRDNMWVVSGSIDALQPFLKLWGKEVSFLYLHAPSTFEQIVQACIRAYPFTQRECIFFFEGTHASHIKAAYWHVMRTYWRCFTAIWESGGSHIADSRFWNGLSVFQKANDAPLPRLQKFKESFLPAIRVKAVEESTLPNQSVLLEQSALIGATKFSDQQHCVPSGSLSIIETAGFLHNATGVIFNERGALTNSIIRFSKDAPKNARFAADKMVNVTEAGIDVKGFHDVVDVAGVAIDATNYFSFQGNYYHWIAETLPRIVAALRYCKKRSFVPTVVVNYPEMGFIQDSISYLKNRFEFHVHWMRSAFVASDCIIYVDGTRKPARRGAAVERMVDSILGSTRREGRGRKKIYVSRRLSSNRRVVNEATFRQLLANRGYEILELEMTSLLEQIEIFREAGVVVGVHGAGLTNMIWMPVGASVVELRPESLRRNDFLCLAAAVGHKFYTIECEIPASMLDPVNRDNSSLCVECERISDLLDQVEGAGV